MRETMMTQPDGSLHPTERQLLAELGDLDPAASQAETLAAWDELIHVSGELMHVGPAPGEWSAIEVLAHLTACELVDGLRYRAMLAEESPNLAEYERASWLQLLSREGTDPGALMALFRALRQANLDFWAHLDEAGRARLGIHPECGPESIELRFKMMAGHDRMHLDQARRALRWARASRPGLAAVLRELAGRR
jgi:hypothetical protein